MVNIHNNKNVNSRHIQGTIIIYHIFSHFTLLHVIRLVRDPLNMFYRFDNLIKLFMKLLSQDWSVVLLRIFQEGNFAVNCLAKLGAKSFESLMVFDTVPPILSSSLLAIGVSFVRRYLSFCFFPSFCNQKKCYLFFFFLDK